MLIQNICKINFKGLWEPVKIITKERGHKNIDKVINTMYQMVYHPLKGETKQSIEKAVNKYCHGLTYTVHDINEGQAAVDMYKVNFVKVGNRIAKKDAKKYIAMGYTRKPFDNVMTVDELYDSYSSAVGCNVNDVCTYNRQQVEAFVARHFNVNI